MPRSSQSQPHLALLNAADAAAETRRNFVREIDADLELFHCPSGEMPWDFDYDGFVITGSWASVYWEKDWIDDLRTWVRGAVEMGLPALGVCYGHQLLAEVMGGRVEDMGEYEIGYRSVQHNDDNVLLDGILSPMTVFTTHSDRVTTRPPGADVIAWNDYGIQGFRKDRVHGVQFHPEYDMAMATQITKGKEGQLPPSELQTILDNIHERNYAAARRAKQLFDNFLAYVSNVQPCCAQISP